MMVYLVTISQDEQTSNRAILTDCDKAVALTKELCAQYRFAEVCLFEWDTESQRCVELGEV